MLIKSCFSSVNNTHRHKHKQSDCLSWSLVWGYRLQWRGIYLCVTYVRMWSIQKFKHTQRWSVYCLLTHSWLHSSNTLLQHWWICSHSSTPSLPRMASYVHISYVKLSVYICLGCLVELVISSLKFLWFITVYSPTKHTIWRHLNNTFISHEVKMSPVSYPFFNYLSHAYKDRILPICASTSLPYVVSKQYLGYFQSVYLHCVVSEITLNNKEPRARWCKWNVGERKNIVCKLLKSPLCVGRLVGTFMSHLNSKLFPNGRIMDSTVAYSPKLVAGNFQSPKISRTSWAGVYMNLRLPKVWHVGTFYYINILCTNRVEIEGQLSLFTHHMTV